MEGLGWFKVWLADREGQIMQNMDPFWALAPSLHIFNFLDDDNQGVTKRCRLSLLTKSTIVYEPKMRGERVSCGVSANEYSCAQ